jgi:hypothetical protein
MALSSRESRVAGSWIAVVDPNRRKRQVHSRNLGRRMNIFEGWTLYSGDDLLTNGQGSFYVRSDSIILAKISCTAFGELSMHAEGELGMAQGKINT